MAQAGGDLDLAEEALGADGAGQLGSEELHRDDRSVLQVLCKVDGGHSAMTELTLDGVAIGEGNFQESERVDHGPGLGRGTPQRHSPGRHPHRRLQHRQCSRRRSETRLGCRLKPSRLAVAELRCPFGVHSQRRRS